MFLSSQELYTNSDCFYGAGSLLLAFSYESPLKEKETLGL